MCHSKNIHPISYVPSGKWAFITNPTILVCCIFEAMNQKITWMRFSLFWMPNSLQSCQHNTPNTIDKLFVDTIKSTCRNGNAYLSCDRFSKKRQTTTNSMENGEFNRSRTFTKSQRNAFGCFLFNRMWFFFVSLSLCHCQWSSPSRIYFGYFIFPSYSPSDYCVQTICNQWDIISTNSPQITAQTMRIARIVFDKFNK